MDLVFMKKIAFLLFILVGCSEPHGTIRPHDLYGDWQSVSRRPLNMSATLSFTDSDACYDPAIGDTILCFQSFKVVGDTLVLDYQGVRTYRCLLRELHDSVLVIQGLPWRERPEKFIRVPVHSPMD
ncbi:hypothetical protein [Prevotella sp. oral taxon 376]|uniref:hypothetical protein n=1 Tax=Prevotella sp. oral taxon 376 TaxID=712466 RepID=UPI0011B1C631|nr:hypothetical protein [Prevotella sp. oral taxon 376]